MTLVQTQGNLDMSQKNSCRHFSDKLDELLEGGFF